MVKMNISPLWKRGVEGDLPAVYHQKSPLIPFYERTFKGQEMTYRRVDPTADCGIQVFGEDLKALFENAGLALFDLIADAGLVKSGLEYAIQVSGSDWPDLMVNWLRELLYFWTGKELLVKEIAVTEILEYRLSARLRVDTFSAARHRLNHEIKAVTYHRIQVTRTPAGWEAVVVFDV
jgi:SHS2 domain-containing protein